MCKNKKISLSKQGLKNPMWKGNKVQYRALHAWVKRNKPTQDYCNKCKKKTEKLELANKHTEYKRDINAYEWLCVKCHRNKDADERRTQGIIPKRKHNKSGTTGVIYCKRDDNWVAYITIKGKQIFLKSSKDKNKVIRARKEAEQRCVKE